METLRMETWKNPVSRGLRPVPTIESLSIGVSPVCFQHRAALLDNKKKKESSRVQGYVSIQAYTHNENRALRPALEAFLSLHLPTKGPCLREMRKEGKGRMQRTAERRRAQPGVGASRRA